ncbi:ras guanine nucleotide exchange factor domain-containing protein [Absidia repens]|uniref:Ras guanine nucleotide exchange factor domain-containing protein n=1 Tax=Absidia repens TaxID=90262 RepID=A0A1X2ID83_9FUNG|nr:ras guanine nucleotide exchange factor domain-containing protein [Absidia repens]
MTPYQLLQSLIERFEQDYGCDNQPTRLQERIRTILCLWLSHHWSDIYYGRSYQTLHRFLQHLGHNQHLSTMYQLLVPLITRAGPLSDPDSVWGLTDEENDTELNSNTSFYGLWANSPSITTMLCMSSSAHSITGNGSSTDNNKKQQQHSSTASLDWFKQVNDPPSLSPTNTTSSSNNNNNHDNNPPTLSSSTPYSSFMDASSCYTTATTSNNIQQKRSHSKRTSLLKSTGHRHSSSQAFMGNPAVFGGGLVLLEATGRRPFSLVALQSSLRHMSHIRYAMLMDLPVDLLAEQLTWVELTLYRHIKPRDYIRHLWGEQGASEAMMASITHGQFIKGWVVTMILTQNHLCQRVALLDKFVDLAYRIYHDHRNYNTLMALLEGMGHVIRCSKQTHLGLEHEKQQQLLELETLMKCDRNYALYRQDLGKTKDGPSIPYLWVHRQDIVNLAETRRDVTLCGGIHWEKFRFMGEIILHLTHGITLATTTQPNPCVLAFISDTTLLTEEERIGRLVELGEK